MYQDFDAYVDTLTQEEYEREFAAPTEDELEALYADWPQPAPYTDDDVNDMAHRFGDL